MMMPRGSGPSGSKDSDPSTGISWYDTSVHAPINLSRNPSDFHDLQLAQGGATSSCGWSLPTRTSI